jgi:hypothetical protein
MEAGQRRVVVGQSQGVRPLHIALLTFVATEVARPCDCWVAVSVN